ncbi:MAG: ABC transporter ATP-binding protein [Candidatus Methylacidiphilales bacterium]|nr:ABC transporter ATP-binding protein [Candidatus Methylacidiphilales bacterium]
MKITLSQIVKRFGTTTIVDHVSAEIQDGEMFFLLGSSGCGKTTLLRMLAGFYHPEEGDIHFGDRRMNAVPPHERNTALVFQNYAVWPHMTVFENVAYGLRVRKTPEAELKTRVNDALAQVKMAALADRKPASLSGGQQQRVALARAMVVRPDLLLFDEPLSNLDAKLRIELREEIKKIHAATRITSVYVTHDQEEALSLADRIAVMNAGKIQQIGTPQDIYNRPANAFVASFIGEINLFPASSAIAQKLAPGADGQVGFRPEKVSVHPDGLPGKVVFSSYLGSKNQVTVKMDTAEEVKAWLPDYHAEGSTLRLRVEEKDLLKFVS